MPAGAIATLALVATRNSLPGNWSLTAASALLLLLVAGPAVAGRFLAAGAVGMLLQQGLKQWVPRVRACLTEGGPDQRVGIPDAGSFPSGHTLHAVLAAVTVCLQVSLLAFVYVPVAVLIALSRVALGVHYPSDVVAGAIVGTVLAVAFQLLRGRTENLLPCRAFLLVAVSGGRRCGRKCS